MVPRWALRFWPDTRPMVDDQIGMAPSNHGTDTAAHAARPGGCAAGVLAAAPRIRVHQGPELVPGDVRRDRLHGDLHEDRRGGRPRTWTRPARPRCGPGTGRASPTSRSRTSVPPTPPTTSLPGTTSNTDLRPRHRRDGQPGARRSGPRPGSPDLRHAADAGGQPAHARRRHRGRRRSPPQLVRDRPSRPGRAAAGLLRVRVLRIGGTHTRHAPAPATDPAGKTSCAKKKGKKRKAGKRKAGVEGRKKKRQARLQAPEAQEAQALEAQLAG